MKNYRNVVEDLVEDYYDERKDTLDCCTCEQCKNDIIALTLNQLTPHYISTPAGETIIRAKTALGFQYMTEIQTAFMKAVVTVKENPRHK